MLLAAAWPAGVFAAPAEPLAPGHTALGYDPPAPGSYALPPLGDAGDGQVLDASGDSLRLHGLLGSEIVVLSFIYSTCSDTNGCPLATAVLYKLRSTIEAQPALAGKVRFVSLSFDPVQDTPEVIRLYGMNFTGSEQSTEWTFLTTASQEQLEPILEAYGQPIQPEFDDTGKLTGRIAHILRVFLIDRERRIRNIYSVSFLHADLVLNDILTLQLERRAQQEATSTITRTGTRLSRAGDDRTGYERHDYQSRSRSVEARTGVAADLMANLEAPLPGLPAVAVPGDNPASPAKVALGRKLFYDRRLSLNNTFSCAMCHVPEQGFTSNELETAVGIEGRSVRRNTPTLYNVAFAERLFHDGRETTLEQQVWAPLLARNEMGNPSIGSVIEKLKAMPDYAGLFEAAFAGKGPSMETVGGAIASYERTLVSGNSPFDRWYYGGKADALRDDARRGFTIFTKKGGCSGCHTVGASSAVFTDHGLHNTGVGYWVSMGASGRKHRVLVAPGEYLEVDAATIASVGERQPNDLGLYEITQAPADRWKYRTPTLRNVALTAPYMHNGSLASLRDVVDFYNQGGVPNELLDPRIRPLHLSESEVTDVVAFLESLTGDNVDVLVSDAFAAPVGDLTEADPDWAHQSRSGQ